MKRNITVVVLLLILLLLSSGCGRQAPRTPLLPALESIEKIELALYYKDRIINKKVVDSTPEEFVERITAEAKPTRRKSVNEQPTNIDKYIAIEFFSTEEDRQSTRVYLYKRRNDYYMEQPYNGIWKVPKTLYQNVTDRFRESYAPQDSVKGLWGLFFDEDFKVFPVALGESVFL